MKNVKKFLFAAFALVMAITLLPIQPAITAYAATTDATIDTTLKGSLTIHKYEYNGSDAIEGTGEATDTVPTGANPLKDAGFTLYKVADVDELKNYYGVNPTSLPSVTEYFTDGDFSKGIIAAKVKETVAEAKTGEDGTVTFSNLPLGLYVVVETTTPDAVTTEMEPFLVSIPMTEADGTDWLYDVHVFPKNKTSYGGVTLEKVDAADNNIKLQGVEFKLEKNVGDTNSDGTDDWISITKKAGAGGDNTGDALTLTTNASGQISVDGLTQGTYRFTEVSLGNTTGTPGNGGYILDKYTTYEFTVNDDGTVSYDKDGDGTIEAGETDENITIIAYNDKPDLEKEVKDRTDGTWGIDSDYNIGDKIPYQLVIEIPTKITLLDKFVVTDTPTHLKDDISTIKLTYGDTKAAATAEGASTVDAAAYTTPVESGDGFTITFKPDAMAAYAGKYIVVSYEAELLSTAVTTTDGNPNTASLVYNREITETGDGAGESTIEDNTIVYTFEIDIVKTAESIGGTALKDVEFDLYKEVTAGTTGAITGDDAKAVGLDTSKSWLKINTTSLKTDENGTVSQKGLANGTYYLVETKTNEGYNLLKEPVEVVLSIKYTTTTTETTQWTIAADGTETIEKTVITSTTFADKTGTDNTGGTTGIEKVEIVNKTGFTLPTTGGVGTVVFVFVGVSMMAAAVILFFVTKKKDVSKMTK